MNHRLDNEDIRQPDFTPIQIATPHPARLTKTAGIQTSPKSQAVPGEGHDLDWGKAFAPGVLVSRAGRGVVIWIGLTLRAGRFVCFSVMIRGIIGYAQHFVYATPQISLLTDAEISPGHPAQTPNTEDF
jgi:hypothetical protein